MFKASHIVCLLALQACGNEFYFDAKPDVPVGDPDAVYTDSEVPVDTEVEVDEASDDPVETDVSAQEESDPPEVEPVESDPPIDSDVVAVDSELAIETDLPIDTDFIPPLQGYYPLDGDLLWPESGAWDEGTNGFYVGSLEFGYVTRVGTAGIQTIWYEHPQTGTNWQTWGIEADSARRKLFVCARKGAVPTDPWAIWVINLDTGALLRDVPLDNVIPGSRCRDFAVNSDTGMVYVTDRDRERVYQFNPNSGAVSLFSDDPQLGVGTMGPDGIAYAPEANAVLVAKAKPPAIIKIDLADPTNVLTLPLNSGDFALQAGHNIEALEFWNGDLWVAGINRIIKVTPNDPALWTDATVTAYTSPLDGASGLTLTHDNRLFTVNGDPFAHTVSVGTADLPFEVSELTLPLTLANP